MPNQNNYAQEIDTLRIGDNIFRFSEEDSYVISGIFADGYIGLDLDKEFVELHFYDQGTNNLVKSVAVPLSEGYLTVLDDTDQENIKLQLQFWTPGSPDNPEESSNSLLIKYLDDLPPGVYDLIINFFSDELGTYDDRYWRMSKISNSRKELILTHDPSREIDLREISQFIDTSMFVVDFQSAMRNNFNISDSPPSQQYQEYLDDFFGSLNILQSGAVNPNKNSVTNDVTNLLDIVYQRIDAWVDNEIIEKRFRITERNFNIEVSSVILNTVLEYVGSFTTQDGDDSGEVPLLVNE